MNKIFKTLLILTPAVLSAILWLWEPSGATNAVALQQQMGSADESLRSPALVWDSLTKEHTAAAGEQEAHFNFVLKNVSTEPVLLMKISTSCGCTSARAGELPRVIAPGAQLPIDVSLNLRGRTGRVSKRVTVITSEGQQQLGVTANLPGASEIGASEPARPPVS